MASVQVSTPQKERAELAEHAEAWGTFVLANIVWAILSIPLVTLPAVTAGLFAFLSARARGEQPNFFQTFFEGIRQHWRKATLLALIDVCVGGMIGANTLILSHMNVSTDPIAFLSRSVTLFAALALLLINLYAWHLMVLLENLTVRQIMTSSVKLVFTHPLWSLGILIAASLPFLISFLLPQGIFVIATASIVTWIICKGTWIIIRQHLVPVSS